MKVVAPHLEGSFSKDRPSSPMVQRYLHLTSIKYSYHSQRTWFDCSQNKQETERGLYAAIPTIRERDPLVKWKCLELSYTIWHLSPRLIHLFTLIHPHWFSHTSANEPPGCCSSFVLYTHSCFSPYSLKRKLHFLSLRWNIIYTVTSSLTYQHRQVSSYKCSVSLFAVFIKIIMESLIVQLGYYFFRFVSLNRMEYPWIKKQSFLFTTVSPSLAEFPDYWNVQQIFLWWIKENMIK